MYKRFKEENPLIKIDYKTFRSVIIDSNELIREMVADSDDAFKLPEGLGYLTITKYKSTKRAVDWVNSKRLRKTIFIANAHSLGYVHHIKWFKNYIVDFRNAAVYKFEPYRLLARHVAKNIKQGKTYHQWISSDFWTKNKQKKLIYR